MGIDFFLPDPFSAAAVPFAPFLPFPSFLTFPFVVVVLLVVVVVVPVFLSVVLVVEVLEMLFVPLAYNLVVLEDLVVFFAPDDLVVLFALAFPFVEANSNSYSSNSYSSKNSFASLADQVRITANSANTNIVFLYMFLIKEFL